MDVTLPPELEQFAADAVAAGRYRDVAQVLAAGVELLKQREQDRTALLASVLAAQEEGDRLGYLTGDEVAGHVRQTMARRAGAPRVTPARRFAPRAQADLDDVVEWLLDQGADPRTAERLLTAVLEAAERLARRPQLGRRRLDLLPDPFRFWSLPRHRLVLVYAAAPAATILRVLHTNRDFRPLLAGIEAAEDPG